MVWLLWLSCARVGVAADDGWPTCGRAPACATSDGPRTEVQRVDPLPLRDVPTLEIAVASLPGCTVWQRDANGLRAACKTPSGLFTDDVVLRIDGDKVHVHSRSRVGWSDLGVNRARVASLRLALER